MYITSPEFDINNWEKYYLDNKNTNLIDIINEIVAEININIKAPKYNFQIEQLIPQNVINNFDKLVEKGFRKYLISDEILEKKQKEFLKYLKIYDVVWDKNFQILWKNMLTKTCTRSIIFKRKIKRWSRMWLH